MSRVIVPCLIVIAIVFVFLNTDRITTAQPDPMQTVQSTTKAVPPTPEKTSWLNSPGLILKGLDLLKESHFALNPSIDFRPNFQFSSAFTPRVGVLEINLGPQNKAYQEVTERLARETNELVKEQLELLKGQLNVLREQSDIAIKQTKIQEQIRDLQAIAFEYQKSKEEALLRRSDYSVPAGKLVVIVSDFSSGGSGEGIEIADEIANALHELRDKCGIDVEILVGEIKPGVVIRSEQMARDIGKQFPKGTCYAVVWGSLSPRTVGKFRPHITCVMKVDDDRGVSRSYTINPDSQPLPRGDTPEDQRRDQHRQLVAFTCAVIPGCYVSYELTQDRRPILDKFYAFLEKDDRGIASKYQEEVKALMTWIDNRTPLDDPKKPQYGYLRRLTPISKDMPFPRQVLNTKDNSIMSLITEPGSDRPKYFDHPTGGKCVVYIDMTETTIRQVKDFLDAKGNQIEGGVKWFNIFPDKGSIRMKENNTFEVQEPQSSLEKPVVNGSYFGAKSFCEWAGKELPRVHEWQEAARSKDGGEYPWGKAEGIKINDLCANKTNSGEPFFVHRVGSYASSDRSEIGCLDMGGNVSEWCAEFAKNSEVDRIICGGDILDEKLESFKISRVRAAPQTTYSESVGFRGVVRIKVNSDKRP